MEEVAGLSAITVGGRTKGSKTAGVSGKETFHAGQV